MPHSKNYDGVEISALEQILVKPNTDWYDTFTLKTPDFNYVQVRKFDSVPPFSSQTVEKEDRHNFVVGPEQYEGWVYRFNEGSEMIISFSATRAISFLIIKGEKNFEDWLDNGSKKGVQYNYFASSMNDFVYYVPSEDTYYFIWKNENTDTSIQGEAVFTISMMVYDLSNYREICVDQSICKLSISRDSSECFIVSATDSNLPDSVYRFDYTLSPRNDYYWTIFGPLLAIFFLATFMIVVAFIILTRRKKMDSSKSPLLSGENAYPPPPTFPPHSQPPYSGNSYPQPPYSQPPVSNPYSQPIPPYGTNYETPSNPPPQNPFV